MKALAAVVLIALQALAAAALFLASIHGPAGLTVGAPLYLGVAAALTWWAGRKSWTLLIVTGTAMLAAAPGLHFVLDKAERIAYDQRLAATQVSEVADEPILSAGKPIGVRLSFSVVVPKRGYFSIVPWLYPRNERLRHLQLVSVPSKWRFDARQGPELGPFEAGRKHRLEFELYPPFLAFSAQGERCLAPASVPPPPETAAGPLLVDISETSYGAPWRGGREEPTRTDYDVAAMYRAVLAEGLPACKVPGQ
jgi:hypothetical protein